jgi:hypothetical protein
MLSAPQPDAMMNFLLARTRPGDEVFIYPYEPIYYFAAQLRNPTRFSNLMYGMNTPAQFAECVSALSHSKVRFVLSDQVFAGENMKAVFPGYVPPSRDRLMLEPFLEAHYREVATVGNFRVLERR